MVFWAIIITLFLALCVLFIVLAVKEFDKMSYDTHEILFAILGTIFGGIVLFSTVGVCCTRLSYNEFEHKFEIQRQQYEYMVESGTIDNDNVQYIIDIVEWNTDLADWQASHEYNGVVSVIPDRVMDIEPIGMK